MQRQRPRGSAHRKDNGGAAVLVLILLCVGVYYLFFREGKPELPETVQQQVAVLDKTIEDLRGLSTFVIDQKRQLEEQERIVQSLHAEQQELGPVVAANRETINAVLAAEATRHESSVWWSRIEGFGMGVLSSLVASLAWSWIARRYQLPSETA